MICVRPRQLPLKGDKCGQLARELLLRGPLMVALSVGLAALQPTVASGQEGGAPPASDEPAAPHEEVTGGRTIGDGQIRLGAAVNAGILTGRPTVTAVRTDTPPIVDGRLDDAVWRRAARITDFVQRQPVDGAPATEDTEVYVAYDSANIYLGFHAHYADPEIMRANRSDRDRAGFSDDLFIVYFDTFLDQQRAYVFSVNGHGVQGDSILGGGFGGGGRGGFGGGAPIGDRSWDALFSSGGAIVEDGFTAELAIPFKSLRYPPRAENTPHRWGFQVVRSIRGKDETVVWSPISRDIAGFLPQAGLLEGLMNLSTSRNLEILPTVTGVQFGSLDDTTGEFATKDLSPEAGVNVKYGVTSNLTADFTINPDFSQIESDRPQVEVNRRFALFFPELRPFFLEGAEIFRVPAPITVVHTRTIVDPLYGAKLTGKTGDMTVGVMYANDEAAGAVDDPTDRAFGKSAQTFVGRVRYDLYAESFLGAVFTDREFLDSSSRLVGVDGNFRLGDRYSWGFRAMGTDRRDLDGQETTGYLIDANFGRRGRKLDFMVASYKLSPDFATDVGFVRRTDQRRHFGNVSYEWRPETWIISWGPRFNYVRNYDFDNVLQDEEASLGLNLNFAQNIRANVDTDRDMERFGGINFHKSRYRIGGNVGTSEVVSLGGRFSWGDAIYFDTANPFLGYERGMNLYVALRLGSRFGSGIFINTSQFTDRLNLFDSELNEGEVRADGEIFDVKIFRAQSSYQFTERLVFRNISEYNTHDRTLDLNFLVTYRVNSGTVFYIGYDDHYRQGDQIDDQLFPTGKLRQTNRAVFAKFQYLFRL